IQDAIANYTQMTGDTQVNSLKFEEQQSDGIGANGHPSVKTHQIAARQLISKIEQDLGWKA
ncbi:MAG: hypothetical protein ACRCTE_07700, partial [Cellulosilyticaceae bacterium]